METALSEIIIQKGWSRIYGNKVMFELGRFLLMKSYNVSEYLAPCEDVDTLWKEIIINTKFYSDYCIDEFGIIIHRDCLDEEQKVENLLWTRELYEEVFDELPPDEIWTRYTCEICSNSFKKEDINNVYCCDKAICKTCLGKVDICPFCREPAPMIRKCTLNFVDFKGKLNTFSIKLPSEMCFCDIKSLMFHLLNIEIQHNEMQLFYNFTSSCSNKSRRLISLHNYHSFREFELDGDVEISKIYDIIYKIKVDLISLVLVDKKDDSDFIIKIGKHMKISNLKNRIAEFADINVHSIRLSFGYNGYEEIKDNKNIEYYGLIENSKVTYDYNISDHHNCPHHHHHH